MSENRRTDWFGVILGTLVFLCGIGLLVYTFLLASDMFSRPASAMIQKENADVTQIGVSFGNVVLQIGKLLVMSIIGSMISSRGVKMYLAARSGIVVQSEKA